jgi:hypothetical protein
MTLPKIKHPVYDHFLVGINKKVNFRPFTGQEQKILLLAKEDNKQESIVSAIKQILMNCTLSKINIEDLPIFDVEDLFLRIRSKSVSEIINVSYRHDYENEEGKPLSEFIKVAINIEDIKVITNPDHTKKIDLGNKIGLVMKYPTIKFLGSSETDEEMVISCIDYIYDENEIYQSENTPKEDLISFYNDIDIKGLDQINKFFQTMPKLFYSTEIELKSGEKRTIKLEGIEDFFM